jgi:hypothetical protein
MQNKQRTAEFSEHACCHGSSRLAGDCAARLCLGHSYHAYKTGRPIGDVQPPCRGRRRRRHVRVHVTVRRPGRDPSPDPPCSRKATTTKTPLGLGLAAEISWSWTCLAANLPADKPASQPAAAARGVRDLDAWSLLTRRIRRKGIGVAGWSVSLSSPPIICRHGLVATTSSATSAWGRGSE